ncbi:MAG: hypothetical protein LBP81_00855 [Treponema sp.]|jgi:hypothetical protein|nr:hypothetical protein [Treponema sp.]
MGRRYFRIGPGLLGFFVFISPFLWPAFSEETGYFPDPDYYAEYGLSPETVPPGGITEELEVLLETSPESPRVYSEWMIRILVNHPNPQEVAVTLPDLPPFLVPDRVRTAARFVVPRTGGSREANPGTEEKWTAVDFFFIPRQDGPVSLAPIEVRVPGRLGYSPPVSALIRGDAREAALRAVWEPAPSSLTIGRKAEVRLRLMTGKAKVRQAAAVSYPIEAPVNAIVEPLGIAETGPGEFVLRIQIIPLEGPSVRLPAALLKYGDDSLAVPGREFPVRPGIPPAESPGPIPDRDSGVHPQGDPAYAGEEPPPAPPFPDAPGAVFPLFRTGYERALGEARAYWDQGLYAEALAVLRLNERELAAGPVLAPLRRSAETALGLGFTEDEGWRPRYFFLFLTAGSAFILTGILFAALVKSRGRKIFPVTLDTSWGYTCIVILLCGMIGAGFYGFFGGPGRVLYSGKSRTGVLRETGSFRAPEDGGVPDTFFRDGEPVRIRSLTDTWAYIESFEGKAGWVPLDRIIPY